MHTGNFSGFQVNRAIEQCPSLFLKHQERKGNAPKKRLNSTYYVLDGSGNQMNVYEHEVDNSNVLYTLKERYIYGSSSVGIKMDSLNMFDNVSSFGNVVTELGNRYYHLTNHLGNVLTVISDKKLPHSSNGTTVDYYTADIISVTDYYAFGAPMPGRTFNADAYRYGAANGQEKVDEISGSGNHYTAQYWEYDPRLGKRWNVDPVVKHHESPYACFANNPIWFKDPNGADTTLDVNSRTLINDLIDPNSTNYNSAYAADFQKLVNDKNTVYSFVQWTGAKEEKKGDVTGTTFGQLSASGKNSSGQNLVNVEYSLETTNQGHKLDALFEESDHAVQFLTQRIGFYENPTVPGDWIVMGYDFMDEVDNKVSVVKYLSSFTDKSTYKTQLYGMNAKILKSNFSNAAAMRAVRLSYGFEDEGVVDVFQGASGITGGALTDQQIRTDFKNGVRWPNILIGGN